MLGTYFFSPLGNKSFVLKSEEIDADFLVYDLEDSLGPESMQVALENIKLVKKRDSFFRPRIIWDTRDFSLLQFLIDKGFRNFVLPKIRTAKDFGALVKTLELDNGNYKIILLIENSRILFELHEILLKWKGLVVALSLGSHDYCLSLGARHDYENYRFANDFVLNIAKAYEITPIDVASMNINEEGAFKEELIRAFNKGFEAKFFLHPSQLDYLSDTQFFDQEEIDFALRVSREFELAESFDAFKFEGRILEKPHLRRIQSILKWIENGK